MGHHRTFLFAQVVGCLWVLWVVSWMLASRWSRQTIKTTRAGERRLEILLTLAGASLLGIGGSPMGLSRGPTYSLGVLPSVLLVLGVTGGFLLCWWARLHLGTLWSMAITLKESHKVIDTGPYAWVRHPIYTGLLIASWGSAAVDGNGVGYLGAILMTAGLYIKARREEQLLLHELGSAYEMYRRRIPMLLPRWPRIHAGS